MAAYVIFVDPSITTTATVTWAPLTWTGSSIELAFPEVEEFKPDDKRARSRGAHAAAVLRGRESLPRPVTGRHGFAQAYRLPCYRGVRTR